MLVTVVKLWGHRFVVPLAMAWLLLFSDVSFAAPASPHCTIHQTQPNGAVTRHEWQLNQTMILSLSGGTHHLTFSCQLPEQGVFRFNSMAVMSSQFRLDDKVVAPLATNQIAYILPGGTIHGSLDVTLESAKNIDFRWSSLPVYVTDMQHRSIAISLFFGLMITLAIYVRIIGWHLNQRYFQLYSVYILSATLFFALQEGYLNIIFPLDGWQNHHSSNLIVAGMTVLAASYFLVSLLDLSKYWPRFVRFGLVWPARFVLLIACTTVFFGDAYLALVNSTMGWFTLYIMAVIFGMIVLAVKRRIHTARLVLVAKSSMFIAMFMRVVLTDSDLAIRRYSLLVSLALEAFILAWATSEKIKRINLLREQAEQDAKTDPLCGVLNRRGWELAAERLIEQQRTQGGVLLMLYIDLNHFKQINDQYGHHVGDEVLCIAAEIIKHQIRDSDAAGRLGGDEFVVMGHFTDGQQSQNLHDRLKQRMLHLTINTSAGEFNVSTSAGIRLYYQPPESVEQVLQEADQAMYTQKRSLKLNL